MLDISKISNLPRIEKVKEKKRIQDLGTVGNSEISCVKLFL